MYLYEPFYFLSLTQFIPHLPFWGKTSFYNAGLMFSEIVYNAIFWQIKVFSVNNFHVYLSATGISKYKVKWKKLCRMTE